MNRDYEIIIEHLDGVEIVELPGRWEVCPRCEGDGLRQGEGLLDCSARTQSHVTDLAREIASCRTCDGRERVLKPDRERLDEEQREILHRWEQARDAFHAKNFKRRDHFTSTR